MSKEYWDWQLAYFLRYGFPLDFPKHEEDNLKNDCQAHASAENYSSHVDKYIKTEIEHEAIYGPYDKPPYGASTHFSPFMTRAKTDSVDRRVIIDLSWPESHSINHFTTSNVYLGTVYKLQYPTVDIITDMLAAKGKGTYMFKIDLSRAFRQLRVDPADFNLLCLKWGGNYYSDGYYPFGHVSGSMACTRLSSFFRYLMFKKKYDIVSYVDDMKFNVYS